MGSGQSSLHPNQRERRQSIGGLPEVEKSGKPLHNLLPKLALMVDMNNFVSKEIRICECFPFRKQENLTGPSV